MNTSMSMSTTPSTSAKSVLRPELKLASSSRGSFLSYFADELGGLQAGLFRCKDMHSLHTMEMARIIYIYILNPTYC